MGRPIQPNLANLSQVERILGELKLVDASDEKLRCIQYPTCAKKEYCNGFGHLTHRGGKKQRANQTREEECGKYCAT